MDDTAHPACSKKNDYSRLERLEKDGSGATRLYFKLQSFQEGIHRVEAQAWDQACNRGAAALEFPVVTFSGSCCPVTPASPGSASPDSR